MTAPAYTYRWQTDSHRVLGELIYEGHKAGLPPLVWTLATTGALTGEAPRLAGHADPRSAVIEWARHLGASVTETPRADGQISLYAPFSRDGQRRGGLRADLFPKDDDQV